jgi:hypothetical protein
VAAALTRPLALLPLQVWRVLTDYEALPSFVPNLERCERLPNPPPGRVLLRQRACSQGALWRLEAEAMLEVEEVVGVLGRREARFTMRSGDFVELGGRWVAEPDPASPAGQATVLRYEVAVQPRMLVPAALASYVVRAGLPANIRAVVARAEAAAGRARGVAGLASWAGVEEDPALPAAAQPAGGEVARGGSGGGGGEGLPAKGPFWAAGSPYAEAAPLTAGQQRRRAARATARSLYLGTTSVPLPSAAGPQSLQQELNERQREKEQVQAMYPAFGLRRSGSGGGSSGGGSSAAGEPGAAGGPPAAAAVASAPSAAASPLATQPAEVHLRRLDRLDLLHRRAVAAVTVDAPASEVWAVLTDYDRLAEFVPNLAASERIALPPGAPLNVVRVRQVGYKRMLYMCLHAESVMDLIEKPQR